MSIHILNSLLLMRNYMKKPGLRDEVCPSRVGIKVASGIPRFFRRSPAYETIQTFLGRVSSILRVRVDVRPEDRKSTRLNSSHGYISYAVFCLKKKNLRCKHQ